MELAGWGAEDPLFWEDVYTLAAVVAQAERNVKGNTPSKPPGLQGARAFKDLDGDND